jgi:UPF0755 protein
MRLNWTRVILITLPTLALVLFLLYQCGRSATSVPRGLDNYIVYVPSQVNFDTVVSRLVRQGIVTNEMIFRTLAEEMNYAKEEMRSGRYEVKAGWDMDELIRHLRSGEQSPVRVTISTARFPTDIAGKVSVILEPDSADFAELFGDRGFLSEINFTPEEFMTLFIPNTYELFWNVSPRGFVNRMIRENKAFWGRNDRLAKARKIGLSPREVYTLASIVEQESNQKDERPTIAGVYLNRLRRNMRLEADPTVVFANMAFGTDRVLYRDLKVNSPYNTYRIKGLPPGPICMASISSIDAVLNAENHQYVFMCAKGDGSGYHSFAETLAGHNQNIAAYKRNLRARGKR